MSQNTQRISIDYNFRTKDGYKRPTVSVELDVPNAEGIVALLHSGDEKVVGLICDSVQSVLTAHVRSYVDGDTDFDQSKLDALVAEGKISIEAIANLPKSERSMLTKEDLEAFAKDYIAIMPDATGKTAEQVAKAASLFVERYKRVAGDNAVLSILQQQLGVFMEAASADVLERHERSLTYLATKVEELLSVKITADVL